MPDVQAGTGDSNRFKGKEISREPSPQAGRDWLQQNQQDRQQERLPRDRRPRAVDQWRARVEEQEQWMSGEAPPPQQQGQQETAKSRRRDASPAAQESRKQGTFSESKPTEANISTKKLQNAFKHLKETIQGFKVIDLSRIEEMKNSYDSLEERYQNLEFKRTTMTQFFENLEDDPILRSATEAHLQLLLFGKEVTQARMERLNHGASGSEHHKESAQYQELAVEMEYCDLMIGQLSKRLKDIDNPEVESDHEDTTARKDISAKEIQDTFIGLKNEMEYENRNSTSNEGKKNRYEELDRRYWKAREEYRMYREEFKTHEIALIESYAAEVRLGIVRFQVKGEKDERKRDNLQYEEKILQSQLTRKPYRRFLARGGSEEERLKAEAERKEFLSKGGTIERDFAEES